MEPDITYPIKDLIEDAQEELKMRHRVYPKRVQEQTMTPAQARRKIAIQEDIITLLKRFQQPSLFAIEESVE